MRIRLPGLLLLFWCSLVLGQHTDLSAYDAYFQALKALEHQEALSHLERIDDPQYTQPLEVFAQLTYEGFLGNSKRYQADCVVRTSDDPFLNAVYQLNTGYYKFYFLQDRTAAYPHFYSALESANETAYAPLQRRALRAILQYFHHEIARNNNNYEVFLDQYQKLIADIHDQVYFQIYEVIFYSSEIDIKSVYHTKAALLEGLIAQLEPDCKLLPKLYLEVALFYELREQYDQAALYYQKVFD